MKDENIYGLYEMMDDFATLTYLKGNAYDKHSLSIYQEALERVREYGRGIVETEVKHRQYAELKQRVFEFETLHPEVKND